MPKPPNFGGIDNNFLSFSEHLTPPVITGINSFVITSSICRNKFEIFGTFFLILIQFRFISTDKTT